MTYVTGLNNILGVEAYAGVSLAEPHHVRCLGTQVIPRQAEPNYKMPAYVGGLLAWGTPPRAGSAQVGAFIIHSLGSFIDAFTFNS